MFRSAFLALLAVLFMPDHALAQDGLSGEAWYKVATGIVAIPAAIVGILLSWNMMQKTRLETRKLELEISEKQSAISKNISPAEKLELLSAPLSESQRALLIVVRFVLLQLTLLIWNFVPEAIGTFLLLVGLGFFWVFGIGSPTAMAFVTAAPTGINLLLKIVYWIIVYGFGWPLFKDTCEFLNIPVKSLLDLPQIGLKNRGGPIEGKRAPIARDKASTGGRGKVRRPAPR